MAHEKSRTRFVGAGAIAGTLMLASVAPAQFMVSPFALRGQPAPGTGGNYQSFDRPLLAANDTIFHTGTTDAPADADGFVMFGNVLFAHEGQLAPGTSSTFIGFDPVDCSGQLNPDGRV